MKLTTLCYIEKNGKYLMLHRIKKKSDINQGKWIGVGGHFEEGEVGYSVSDNDTGELAEKIEAVVDDYEAISRRCVESAERFDWNIIADSYKEIYEEM